MEPCRRTLSGRFDRDAEPALKVREGDSVIMATLEADWRIKKHSEPKTDSGVFFKREFPRDEGQALTGPVYVSGAKTGGTLAVHIDGLVPGDWGWSRVGGGTPEHMRRLGASGGEQFLLWDIDAAAGIAVSSGGHRVRLNPFMGVMGVAPAGGPVTTYNPGPHGGNMDLKELSAGSVLYLPVFADGALFSLGDGHAAQGDGEGGGTAIECPFKSVRLRFFFNDEPLDGPLAETRDSWIIPAFSADLNEAVYGAFLRAARWLEMRFSMERREAMNICGIIGDIRITQIANGVRGAHVAIKKDALEMLKK